MNCKSLSERWSSIQMGIRFDKKVWDRSGWHHVPDTGLGMDVLMFGFDSVSRNTFIRKLPKSYKYFTKVMKGIVLEGYGDFSAYNCDRRLTIFPLIFNFFHRNPTNDTHYFATFLQTFLTTWLI